MEELESLPYIEEVLSPTRFKEPVKLGLTVVQRHCWWQDDTTQTKLLADSHALPVIHMGRLVCLHGRERARHPGPAQANLSKPDAIA